MTSIVLGGYISVLNSHVINVVIPKMMSGLGQTSSPFAGW
jgi:hypothetical protein